MNPKGQVILEPANDKRAWILDKPDMAALIAVVVAILVVNGVMLLILF